MSLTRSRRWCETAVALQAPTDTIRPPPAATVGLSAAAMYDLVERSPIQPAERTKGAVGGVPEGKEVGEEAVVGEANDLPGQVLVLHGGLTGGLLIYGDDDNFVKLANVSIWETRQTEFAKELSLVPSGYPRYGNSVVGPPADSTYLRIVHRTKDDVDLYTAYTSSDGVQWVRGGTWTASLGPSARIGLVSMGGSGFTAAFDYADGPAQACPAISKVTKSREPARPSRVWPVASPQRLWSFRLLRG